MSAIRCTTCSRWLTLAESKQACPRCGGLERTVFAHDGSVAEEKAAVAKELANKHYQAEAGLQKIIRITGTAQIELKPVEPIKLLEVNAATIPSGVMPVSFGPAPASGVPYSSIIVEVSPEEYAKIQAHELSLPNGWMLGDEFPKPCEESRAH